MFRFQLPFAGLALLLAWSFTPAFGEPEKLKAESKDQQRESNPTATTNKVQDQAQNRPTDQLSQKDRFRRHNNEWWFWNQNQTWSYYRDGQWSKYDQSTFRRPPVVRYAPQRQTVYSQQPNQPEYRNPGGRTYSSQPGYYQGDNSGYAPYNSGQRYYSGGQRQGYGGQPYGYGSQPYGYGGQRYGTGYRGGYQQRGSYPQSREGRTGAAVGGIIGGRQGAAIGGFIGEATRD